MSFDDIKVLYSHHGRNTMEVVEHGTHRSLHFRGSVVQSSMLLEEPAKLVLRYTQYMMVAALLAQPHPGRVLLVGVGAGSMLHFFHHYLPQCRVEAVDYSPEVIAVAREYFALPETANISVHCEDGLRYLDSNRLDRPYDLILVDAFDDAGMAGNIYSSEFFRLAARHLTDTGIICCNLWSGDVKMYRQVKKAILQHSRSSLFIPVRQRENVIALLFRHSLPWTAICPPASVLDELSRRFDIDFTEVSHAASKNMRLGERIERWFS